MRVNVYAEEMTNRIEVIAKEIEGKRFTGLRFYLELPATVAGRQYQGPFMHGPNDDDSAAVTFWGKRDLRSTLRDAMARLDAHYAGEAPQAPPSIDGVHVGNSIHDGQPVGLVLLPGEFRGTWQEARTWAEEQGGSLPSRIDLLVLFQRAPNEFKAEYYWSDEQYDAEWAWYQSFGHGSQYDNRKDGQLRARAVRRLIL